VDTIGSKNEIVLRGTVKTETQKALAQRIAEQHSEGYKIVNQLRVTG
jgi:osmotically-inducible protein OsmY